MPQHPGVPKVLFASIAALSFALCAPAWGESLLQVYRDALANDPTYAAARLQFQANEEKVPQARAGLLPNVALTGSWTRVNYDALYPAPIDSVTGEYTNRVYSLSLSQPLFRWQNWVGYQQSQLGLVASEAQFVQSKQDLILRVAQAYFDVLGAQDSLDFTRAQKTAIAEQLASAKRNFEVGTATITDTNEAQARFDLATAQEIASVSDLEIKQTALLQIVGKPVPALTPLGPNAKLPAPQPIGIDTWVSSAEKDNIGVRVAQVSAEIAKREISKARGGHYPTVDLVASRNKTYSPTSGSADQVTSTQAGIQVSIPLFAGLATQSRVRETLALDEQAQQNLEAAKRSAAQSARSAYLGVTNGLAQVRALEAAEVSSKTALEANQLGYRVGVRVNIDVLNAQQQLFQTRRDLSKARYDTLVGGLKLKSAVGVLDEPDVLAIDGLLVQP